MKEIIESMKKKIKKLIKIALLSGISIISFALIEVKFSIFHIDSIFSKTENTIIQPTQEQIEDEKRWIEARSTISNFYNYLNLFQYKKARSYLTAGYAREVENYSVEKLQEWEDQKSSKTKIVNFERTEAGSKDTTKVFNYETRYDLKNKGGNCGEKLMAYVVLRENTWSIDTIQLDGYKECE